jgi:hypothetical protein
MSSPIACLNCFRGAALTNSTYADDSSRSLTQRLGSHGRSLFSMRRSFRRRSGVDYDPRDRAAREQLAERLFEPHRCQFPTGTVERARLLLDIIQESFPTDALTSAYFDNLDLLLGDRRRRPVPGKIVVGLGSGRNGSTSLASVLARVEGSCCTHENPPLISWTPEPEELRFHIRRFQRLAEYYPLVGDVSHWWLNVIDDLFANFPGAKAVGASRTIESCALSFMKIKGLGPGSCNHWAPYGNGWTAERWDATYPSYDVPENAWRDPDSAKFELIARYVEEYNESMQAMAARFPDRVMLVNTEHLNDADVQNAIYNFVGMSGVAGRTQLNVGTTDDGRKFRERYML